MYNYIAFFDLDKTIISVNSGVELVRLAHKKGIMATRDFINGIYLSVLNTLHLKQQAKILEQMASWLEGQSQEAIKALSAELFNNYLRIVIRREIIAEIKHHRENHASVVLLSSAITPLCSVAAQYLELDDYICSDFEVTEGLYTGKPVGKICFAEEKLRRLREYCSRMNYDLGDTYYYADSISDIFSLNAIGHPVCVNPDKKLRKLAKENGWGIMDLN